jgi:DNA-binding response OmpR family regulator
MVLVVSGDPDVRLPCRATLEAEGHEVHESRGGDAALELIARHRPDVVLLDVGCPDPDGWRMLEAIRSRPAAREIPVVLLSAREREADRVRGWSQGASDHLARPFSPLALSQVVQDVLATPPAEAAHRRQAVLERSGLLRLP